MDTSRLLRSALEALARGDTGRVRSLLERALSEIAPSGSARWKVGDVVHDRWEVFGEARGGMGHVHFVLDREWDARLAVKTLLVPADLPPERASSMARLFRRETQLWLDLGAHPHIVSAYHTLELDGGLRLFMEYVAGQSLAEVLRAGRVPPTRAIDLALQIVSGMEFVHAREVVHRDLKPANCLVGADDTLRVTDFGLGKQERGPAVAMSVLAIAATGMVADHEMPSTQPSLQMSLHAAGTPLYMAPEQWVALGDAGKAADVYAFGVTLYEMLVGVAPFGIDPATWELAPPPAVGAMRHLEQLHRAATPRPPSQVVSESPASLDELVLDCLRKNPDDRPSFAALRDRLLDIHHAITGRAYPRPLPGGLDRDEGGENNRAVSYHAMGQLDRAREILDTWLSGHPDALYPWLNLQMIALDDDARDPAAVAGELRERLANRPLASGEERQLAATMERLQPFLLGHPDEVTAVCAGRGRVATGCSDRIVRLWRGGVLEREWPVPSAVVWLTGLRDGRLVGCLLDGSVVEWSLGDGVARIVTSVPGCRVVETLPDGGVAIAGGNSIVMLSPGTEPVVHYAPTRVVTMATDLRGERFLVASDGGRCEVWGRTGRTAVGISHDSWINACAFSPDGRLAATCDQKDLAFWDPATGAVQHNIIGEARLRAGTFSKDGRIFAAAADNDIQLFDPMTGRLVRTFTGHRGPIYALAFGDNGELFSVSADRTARRWLLAEAESSGEPKPWNLLLQRGVSPQERLARRSERDQLLARIRDGDSAAMIPLTKLRSRAPEYRHDPEIVGALEPLAARSVRVAVRDAWCMWRGRAAARIGALRWTDAGFVIACRDGSVRHHGHDGQPAASVRGPGAFRTIALSADGRTALSGGSEGIVSCWSTERGATLATLEGHTGWIEAVAFAPDDRRAATGSDDRTARLWDLDTGRAIGTPFMHPAPVWSCQLTADGARLVTGCRDGIARVWDLATGAVLVALDGQTEGLAALMSRTGGILATAHRDRTVGVWSLRHSTGARWHTLPPHNDRITTVAFSPDARLLVTGGGSDSARLWDVGSGRLDRILVGPEEQLHAAAFHPAGTRLLLGHDQTATIWQLDFELAFPDDIVTDLRGLHDHGASRLWPHARTLGPEEILDELQRVCPQRLDELRPWVVAGTR